MESSGPQNVIGIFLLGLFLIIALVALARYVVERSH